LHAQQHATSVPQEQAPHAPAQSQRSLGSNYHQAVSLIQSALSQLPLLYAGSASHNHPPPPSSHPFSQKKKQQQHEQQQQESRPTQSSICPGQREQMASGRAAEEAHNSDQAKSLAALSNAHAEVRALRQTIVSRLPDSAQETRRNA
jgi:type IV secretory pathway VirB10-like protein